MTSPSKCDHTWLAHVVPNICMWCGIPRPKLPAQGPRPRLKIPAPEQERSGRGGRVYFLKHRRHP